jgi:hypothetical protein
MFQLNKLNFRPMIHHGIEVQSRWASETAKEIKSSAFSKFNLWDKIIYDIVFYGALY